MVLAFRWLGFGQTPIEQSVEQLQAEVAALQDALRVANDDRRVLADENRRIADARHEAAKVELQLRNREAGPAAVAVPESGDDELVSTEEVNTLGRLSPMVLHRTHAVAGSQGVTPALATLHPAAASTPVSFARDCVSTDTPTPGGAAPRPAPPSSRIRPSDARYPPLPPRHTARHAARHLTPFASARCRHHLRPLNTRRD